MRALKTELEVEYNNSKERNDSGIKSMIISFCANIESQGELNGR